MDTALSEVLFFKLFRADTATRTVTTPPIVITLDILNTSAKDESLSFLEGALDWTNKKFTSVGKKDDEVVLHLKYLNGHTP